MEHPAPHPTPTFLNAATIRCAGLSVFKPYRPVLRLVTASLVGLLLLRQGINRRTLGTIMCSMLLTFSEDALAVINRHGSLRIVLQRAAGILKGDSSTSGSSSTAQAAAPAMVKWRLDVDGMRCQACAARVRGSVVALPGVRNATVELQQGRVEVWTDGGIRTDLGSELAGTIGAIDASYAVQLAGQECYSKDDQPVPCGQELVAAFVAAGQQQQQQQQASQQAGQQHSQMVEQQQAQSRSPVSSSGQQDAADKEVHAEL